MGAVLDSLTNFKGVKDTYDRGLISTASMLLVTLLFGCLGNTDAALAAFMGTFAYSFTNSPNSSRKIERCITGGIAIVISFLIVYWVAGISDNLASHNLRLFIPLFILCIIGAVANFIMIAVRSAGSIGLVVTLPATLALELASQHQSGIAQLPWMLTGIAIIVMVLTVAGNLKKTKPKTFDNIPWTTSIISELRLNSYSTVRSLRIFVASLASLIISLYFKLDPTWAILTVNVLMGSVQSRKHSLAKGIQRSIGTIIGLTILYFLLTLHLIPASIFGFLIFISIIRFMVDTFTSINYGISVIFITIIVLMIDRSTLTTDPLVLFETRLFDVLIATACSLISYWVFFPKHNYRLLEGEYQLLKNEINSLLKYLKNKDIETNIEEQYECVNKQRQISQQIIASRPILKEFYLEENKEVYKKYKLLTELGTKISEIKISEITLEQKEKFQTELSSIQLQYS